jgi:predicted transcriptional regulator
MAEFTHQVDELAHERGVPESRILEEALEQGVKQMWVQTVLSKYLEGEIERSEAAELVGLEKVKQAEKEVEAVEEDIEWGATA